MIDLSLFRALEQSRKTIEEEFHPSQPARLACEVCQSTPKRLHTRQTKQHRLIGERQRA
jgi:hypothetical protein